VRILFVIPYYKPSPGGVERVIDRFSAQLLLHNDIERVGVLTSRAYHPERRILTNLPAYENDNGVEIYRCTFSPADIPRVLHADIAGYVSREAFKIVHRFKPDVLHFTSLYWWAVNASLQVYSPNSAQIMSTFYHPIAKVRRAIPYRFFNRRSLRSMNAVHVLSAVERSQIHEDFNVPMERIAIIPPGIDSSPTIPQRSGRKTVKILAVGRLQEAKGQLALVQIFARLYRELSDTAIYLHLVGKDAGAGQDIRVMVSNYGLEAAITIEEYCSDSRLADLYAEADIFALPTTYESYGLVFFEAMARALPVVTYGVGPVPSLLTEGALVVPPYDAQAFFSALKYLITNPQERLRLGEAGSQLVSQHHSWSVAGEQLHRLYIDSRSKPMGLRARATLWRG